MKKLLALAAAALMALTAGFALSAAAEEAAPRFTYTLTGKKARHPATGTGPP